MTLNQQNNTINGFTKSHEKEVAYYTFLALFVKNGIFAWPWNWFPIQIHMKMRYYTFSLASFIEKPYMTLKYLSAI